MTEPFKERRKHIRIYRNFILSYEIKGRSFFKNNISQVNNVSRGGINFTSTHPLKQGVVVKIDLKTPFISDSIHLEGVVLECKEKIPDMLYEVRVYFQEMTQQILDLLEKIEIYSKAKEG